jgi:hypothetical protein
MAIKESIKQLIDDMSYEGMLESVRFAQIGEPLFCGEVGEYFAEVMNKKRKEIGDAGHTAASKKIGWDKW